MEYPVRARSFKEENAGESDGNVSQVMGNEATFTHALLVWSQ